MTNKPKMKILKKIDKPILFVGLPLTLAYWFIGVAFVGVVTIIILVQNGFLYYVPIPLIASLYTMIRIRLFYKKYGHKGYSKKQREMNTRNYYEMDMSLVDIIRKNKNG